jgi:hypothetical protein
LQDLPRDREIFLRIKVIAADMPLGLLVGDGKHAEGRGRFEGVANGDGPALSWELESRRLLSFIKSHRIANVTTSQADASVATLVKLVQLVFVGAADSRSRVDRKRAPRSAPARAAGARRNSSAPS